MLFYCYLLEGENKLYYIGSACGGVGGYVFVVDDDGDSNNISIPIFFCVWVSLFSRASETKACLKQDYFELFYA